MAGAGTGLAGWTPIRIDLSGPRPAVDWCLTEGIGFDDPFFDQTVERCLRHPFRLLFRRTTAMEEVVAWSTDHPGLTPSGFVFHGSRCGSTLVTQMLDRLPSTLCVSEAGPVDTVLRAGPAGPPGPADRRVAWLRAVVGALAQPRSAGHRHAVFKLDAWSVLWLPLVRAAFPDVPWAFVYRDPVEVLVSQRRRRGYHMIPGALAPGDLGLSTSPQALDPDQFTAEILGRLYQAGLAGHDPGRSVLVDHAQLPDAVPDVLAPHFGIDCPEPARRLVMEAAAVDAKNPALPYRPDGPGKRREASRALLAAARQHVAVAYEALEKARVEG